MKPTRGFFIYLFFFCLWNWCHYKTQIGSMVQHFFSITLQM